MAITFKTSGRAQFDTPAATSINIAFDLSNTAGSLLVAGIAWSTGGLGNAPTSVTDTRGNTWTLYSTPVYDTPNSQGLTFAYAVNCAAGANTVTVNYGTATDYQRVTVTEYAGVAISSPIDVVASNVAANTGATDNVTSTAATTTVNGDLIWGHSQKDNASVTQAPGTGFTQREYLASDYLTEDLIQATAGSIAATWTFNTTSNYLAFMVAFKAATPPSIVGTSVGGGNGSSNTLPTVTGGYQAGDLILAAMYTEPSNEGTGSATYGTWSVPGGYTFLPLSPQNSNDANLTTQNTSRCYSWYKWATGSETSGTAIDVTGGSTPWVSAGGVIVIRGAVNSAGAASGTPYHEGTSGGTAAGAGNFPALSLTLANTNTLAIYLASNWNSTVAALSGWTETGGTECYWLYKTIAAAGATGTIQPTSGVGTDNLLTGMLVSFRSTADTVGVRIAWVTA